MICLLPSEDYNLSGIITNGDSIIMDESSNTDNVRELRISNWWLLYKGRWALVALILGFCWMQVDSQELKDVVVTISNNRSNAILSILAIVIVVLVLLNLITLAAAVLIIKAKDKYTKHIEDTLIRERKKYSEKEQP